MITKQEFRDMVNKCPDDFEIRFVKWSHIDEEMINSKSFRGWPNITGVKIGEKEFRHNDTDGKPIIIMNCIEDDDSEDMTFTKQEVIDMCGVNEGYIDFQVCIEYKDGKYDFIKMKPSIGDFGYSDRIMTITFDEI